MRATLEPLALDDLERDGRDALADDADEVAHDLSHVVDVPRND